MQHEHDTDDEPGLMSPIEVVGRLQGVLALAIPVVIASLLAASRLG